SASKTGLYGTVRQPIPLQNPLSPDAGFLRNTLITDLLDNISWNNNRMAANLRLFQIGRIFYRNAQGAEIEPLSLACTISGQREEQPFWGRPNTAVDYFQLRGVLDTLFRSLQLPACRIVPAEDPAFQKGNSFEIRLNDVPIGFMGRIDPDLLKNRDIRNETFMFEVFPEEVMRFVPALPKTKPLSRYPSVLRDLAWLVDETVQSSRIETLIRQNGGPHLVSVDLFDLYQGKQVPQGKKSMAYSLCFTSQERTLTDEDVDPVIEKLVQAMRETFSASLRQ
ncbi:hypothetical protein JW906_10685, partial [bacterium]|nr:hypothetical protein [bacterium]